MDLSRKTMFFWVFLTHCKLIIVLVRWTRGRWIWGNLPRCLLFWCCSPGDNYKKNCGQGKYTEYWRLIWFTVGPGPNRYLVHESLVEDPGFYASDGIMITELAMRCIQGELISVLPWRMLSSVWRGYKLFNFMAM